MKDQFKKKYFVVVSDHQFFLFSTDREEVEKILSNGEKKKFRVFICNEPVPKFLLGHYFEIVTNIEDVFGNLEEITRSFF